MNCLHIYTGNGKGKTTAAMGLALRALGYDKKVVVCQFFKNGGSGEIKALQTFENLIYLKSETALPRFANMNEEQKQQANEKFVELFEKAIALVPSVEIIVFDEIISTYNYGFLDKNRVVTALEQAKNYCEVVITGRDAPQELCELADYISNVEKIKHPYDKGVSARKGIEY